jgi:hypothetical protein
LRLSSKFGVNRNEYGLLESAPTSAACTAVVALVSYDTYALFPLNDTRDPTCPTLLMRTALHDDAPSGPLLNRFDTLVAAVYFQMPFPVDPDVCGQTTSPGTLIVGSLRLALASVALVSTPPLPNAFAALAWPYQIPCRPVGAARDQLEGDLPVVVDVRRIAAEAAAGRQVEGRRAGADRRACLQLNAIRKRQRRRAALDAHIDEATTPAANAAAAEMRVRMISLSSWYEQFDDDLGHPASRGAGHVPTPHSRRDLTNR